MKLLTVILALLIMLFAARSACALDEPITADGQVIVNVTGQIHLSGFQAFKDFYRHKASQFGDDRIIELVFNKIATATVPLTAATTDFTIPKKITGLQNFINSLKEMEYQHRASRVAEDVKSSTDVINFIAAIDGATEAYKLISAIQVLEGVKNDKLPYQISVENEIRSITPEITLLPTSTPLPKPTSTPLPKPTLIR